MSNLNEKTAVELTSPLLQRLQSIGCEKAFIVPTHRKCYTGTTAKAPELPDFGPLEDPDNPPGKASKCYEIGWSIAVLIDFSMGEITFRMKSPDSNTKSVQEEHVSAML